jgi:hypothetical protein
VFVKPARLGLLGRHRQGVAEARGRRALEGAFAHDSLVIVEAFSDGLEVECSVIGLDEPEVSVPARSSWRRPSGTTTRPSTRRRDAAAGAGAHPRRRAEEVRRLARRDVLRVGCAGLARVDFFVEGDRVLVNELNTMPGFTARACSRSCGRPAACRSGAVRPAARARARALPRERAGHASRRRLAAPARDLVISTWSASGGSAVIQTR